MASRSLSIGLALVAASSFTVAAQQAVRPVSGLPAVSGPAAPTAVVLDPAMKYQIQQLEGALTTAVRHGADKLAEEFNKLAPNLPIYTGPARTHGFPVPGGFFFDIEIPMVNADSIALYLADLQYTTFQGQPQPLGPGRPVSGTGPADAVSNADRMQAILNSPAFQNPRAVYHLLVREALVDAMLDSSGVLPLTSDDWLAVGARSGVEGLSGSSTMLLRVKQEDLVAYRGQKFDKDAAKNKDIARTKVLVSVF